LSLVALIFEVCSSFFSFLSLKLVHLKGSACKYRLTGQQSPVPLPHELSSTRSRRTSRLISTRLAPSVFLLMRSLLTVLTFPLSSFRGPSLLRPPDLSLISSLSFFCVFMRDFASLMRIGFEGMAPHCCSSSYRLFPLSTPFLSFLLARHALTALLWFTKNISEILDLKVCVFWILLWTFSFCCLSTVIKMPAKWFSCYLFLPSPFLAKLELLNHATIS